MIFFFAFADDMDINDCPLMGAHGYCSQEMVHLFLLGKAISNTFDGDKILDEATILKGIHKRSDIGNGQLGVKVRNMKMDYNTGGTWRRVGQ